MTPTIHIEGPENREHPRVQDGTYMFMPVVYGDPVMNSNEGPFGSQDPAINCAAISVCLQKYLDKGLPPALKWSFLPFRSLNVTGKNGLPSVPASNVAQGLHAGVFPPQPEVQAYSTHAKFLAPFAQKIGLDYSDAELRPSISAQSLDGSGDFPGVASAAAALWVTQVPWEYFRRWLQAEVGTVRRTLSLMGFLPDSAVVWQCAEVDTGLGPVDVQCPAVKVHRSHLCMTDPGPKPVHRLIKACQALGPIKCRRAVLHLDPDAASAQIMADLYDVAKLAGIPDVIVFAAREQGGQLQDFAEAIK